MSLLKLSRFRRKKSKLTSLKQSKRRKFLCIYIIYIRYPGCHKEASELSDGGGLFKVVASNGESDVSCWEKRKKDISSRYSSLGAKQETAASSKGNESRIHGELVVFISKAPSRMRHLQSSSKRQRQRLAKLEETNDKKVDDDDNEGRKNI